MVLQEGHATCIIAERVDKPTDSLISRCFAIATDASSYPISCGNGDQSYLAPACTPTLGPTTISTGPRQQATLGSLIPLPAEGIIGMLAGIALRRVNSQRQEAPLMMGPRFCVEAP